MIKYRYQIALVIFALLVIFKVNGSNISCWANYIDESGKSTTVVGQARDIRSDEWGVLVPIYLSQQNGDTPFSIINYDITSSGQNVVLTLDAPVRDIYTITHPVNWGFLFLSSDYALSWYWDLKLILIIMLAFELCMILTKQNKLISTLGAFWIGLSPAVQWWFAQHVGNNVLYMEAMVVTFYYFLKFFNKLPLKIIFAFLFSLSCLGFVIPFYPAIQVPFGFLTILLIALIFTDFKKQIKIKKTDIIILSVVAIFTFAMLGHLYFIIKDGITLMRNTIYPGQRVSTGGGTKSFYFYTYLTNVLLPYTNVNVINGNACELSSFFNFLPAVLLALPVLIKRRKESLKYGIGLAIFSAFFAIYMTWSFVPKAIAKITLLSYVTGSRAMLAYSFSAMLLSIWALGEFSRSGGLSRIYSAVASLIVAATYVLTYKFTELNGSARLRYYIIIIGGFTLLSYLLLRARKRSFSMIMACVVFVSGATVNPVNIGAGAILNNTISSEIRAVDKTDKTAVWMADETVNNWLGAMGIIIYANGAKSLGGINNYPDMGKWSRIDPKHKFDFIYNRSAHVSFHIVNTQTTFILHGANSFRVDININDIRKFNVRYIVSCNDLTKFDNSNINFKALYARDGKNYTIYQVNYR